MEEFISLGASEPGASEGIIDLDHALQVDAAHQAVDLNLNLNAQPQGKPSTSTSSLLDIIDLEEGQVASQEASAQHAQGTAADNPHQAKPQQEALGANGGVGPPPSDGVIDLEEGQVEDMDLSDDNALVVVTKQHGRVSAAQTPKANNDGPPLSTLIDQSRILLSHSHDDPILFPSSYLEL